MAPKGLEAFRSGSGNSASRLAIDSGPMKIRWVVDRGNRYDNCVQTSRGRDDSARAPRMKILTGGLESRRPAISLPWPVRGGCNVYRSAEGHEHESAMHLFWTYHSSFSTLQPSVYPPA